MIANNPIDPDTPAGKFYPDHFYDADSKSIRAQRTFKNLFRLELFVLIIAAIISIIPAGQQKLFPDSNIEAGNAELLRTIAFAAALAFIFELILRLYIRFSSVQSTWYYGRAIAESLKTLTWKYTMNTEPFRDQKDADRMFESTLLQVFDNTSIPKSLIPLINEPVMITTDMARLRKEGYEANKRFYKQERIQNQFHWYTTKATYNRRFNDLFFVFIMLLYVTSLILSIYYIYRPAEISFVPVVTVLAASFLAWSQLNNYQELENSYATAARDITLLGYDLEKVQSEAEFVAFVSDAENAFSREHTVWLARKDVLDFKSLT